MHSLTRRLLSKFVDELSPRLWVSDNFTLELWPGTNTFNKLIDAREAVESNSLYYMVKRCPIQHVQSLEMSENVNIKLSWILCTLSERRAFVSILDYKVFDLLNDVLQFLSFFLSDRLLKIYWEPCLVV